MRSGVRAWSTGACRGLRNSQCRYERATGARRVVRPLVGRWRLQVHLRVPTETASSIGGPSDLASELILEDSLAVTILDIAEKLLPVYHPFGRAGRRRYGLFETYNRDNVPWPTSDVPDHQRQSRGIERKEGLFELDVIIFATGFEEVRSLHALDLKAGKRHLRDQLVKRGRRSNLGLMVGRLSQHVHRPPGPWSTFPNARCRH